MSAYDGYNKTGDDSGGFFAGGSQQGSQGGGGKNYQDESLRPVTIKQVLEAEEVNAGADFKIDGAILTQLTFVGQVRNVTAQPTNVTLKIDDGTGQIEVKRWIDTDKQEDAAVNYELDSYVRVWGRLKSFNNKRHVGAHVIRAVEDFNEVNYHLLEATYTHLYFTKGPLGAGGQNGHAANGDSMFVDGGAGTGANGGGAMNGKLSGCSALARKMYTYMSEAPGGNEGIHLNVITNNTGMAVRDVLQGSDELLSQGLIYTTVDDETWAILEY